MEEQYIYGRNPVMELLKNGRAIDKLYVQKGELKGSIGRILSLASQNGVIVQRVEREKLDSLSKGEVHQGVVAFTAGFEYKSIEDGFKLAEEKGEDPFFVILDGIEDTHNLGAIIRTAECAGVHAVIIPKRRSAMVNETVYKASAGAVDNMIVVSVTNLNQEIKELKERNVWIYGLDMDGQKYTKANLLGPVALVVGSEGKGLSDLVKKNCDAIISLPMFGKTNSLNASNAAAIAMYEILRQKDEKEKA